MSISPQAGSVPSPADSGGPPAAESSPESPLSPPDRIGSQQQQRSPLAPLVVHCNRMDTDQGGSNCTLTPSVIPGAGAQMYQQDIWGSMLRVGSPCCAKVQGDIMCPCCELTASADGAPAQTRLPAWQPQLPHWRTIGSRSGRRGRSGSDRPSRRQARQQRHHRCPLPAWTPRTGRRFPRPPRWRLFSRRHCCLCSSRAAQPLLLTSPQQQMPLCKTPIAQHTTQQQSRRQLQQAPQPSSQQRSRSRRSCSRRRRRRRQCRRMRSSRKRSSGASPGSATPLRLLTAATWLPGGSPRCAPTLLGRQTGRG